MNAELKSVLKTCMIAILVFLLLDLIVTIYLKSIYKKYDDYITIEGTILDTWEKSVSDGENSRINYYTKFTYEINDQHYENTTKGMNFENSKYSTIELLVNPNDYQDSIIAKDRELYKLLPPILFILTISVSVMMLIANVIAVYRRTRHE